MATFLVLKLVFFVPIAHLAYSKCWLKGVVGAKRRYTVSLWGKEITRSCLVGERFDDASCGCVGDISDARMSPSSIRNGVRSAIGDVPWALSMVKTCPGQSTSWYCSGVLVSNWWALTAQHCVVGCSSPSIYVCGGRPMRDKPSRPGSICGNVVQRHYDWSKYGDIALVKLDRWMRDTVWDHKLRRIHMMKPGTSYEGQRCIIAGIGRQGVGIQPHPSVACVRATHLKGVPPQGCCPWLGLQPTSNTNTVMYKVTESYMLSWWGNRRTQRKPPDIDIFIFHDRGKKLVEFLRKLPSPPLLNLATELVEAIRETSDTILAKRNCGPPGWRKQPWSICVRDRVNDATICAGDSGGGLVCTDEIGHHRVLGIASQNIKYKNGIDCPPAQSMYASVQGFYDYAMGIILSQTPSPFHQG